MEIMEENKSTCKMKMLADNCPTIPISWRLLVLAMLMGTTCSLMMAITAKSLTGELPSRRYDFWSSIDETVEQNDRNGDAIPTDGEEIQASNTNTGDLIELVEGFGNTIGASTWVNHNNNNNSLPNDPEYKHNKSPKLLTSRRRSKVIHFFSIPSDGECLSQDGRRTGTCLNAYECRQKGGMARGECAMGFGVCCVFVVNCNQTIAHNITYLVSPLFPSYMPTNISSCTFTINLMDDDISQLRIDFNHFYLGQPNRRSGVCDGDVFTISGGPGGNLTLCGQNSGQHIYYDVVGRSLARQQNQPIYANLRPLSYDRLYANISYSEDRNIQIRMSFSNRPASIRLWEIRIAQIPFSKRAPAGCLQYHTGRTGIIQTFNFADNGRHLANQNYRICMRQETEMCSIMYQPCDEESFRIGPVVSVTTNAFPGSPIGNNSDLMQTTVLSNQTASTIGTSNMLFMNRTTTSPMDSTAAVTLLSSTTPIPTTTTTETTTPNITRASSTTTASTTTTPTTTTTTTTTTATTTTSTTPTTTTSTTPTSTTTTITTPTSTSTTMNTTIASTSASTATPATAADSTASTTTAPTATTTSTTLSTTIESTTPSTTSTVNYLSSTPLNDDVEGSGDFGQSPDATPSSIAAGGVPQPSGGFDLLGFLRSAFDFRHRQYQRNNQIRKPRQFFNSCSDRITMPCIIEDFIGTGFGPFPGCEPVHCGNQFCSSGMSPCRIESTVTPFYIGIHFGNGAGKGLAEDNIGACLRYAQVQCM